MSSILLRNVGEELETRLRQRAAAHGRSMEAEARAILEQELVAPDEPTNLADLARSLFGPRGIDLEDHPDEPVREPPYFGS